MHACGHDAHTAMLLGTAKALKSMEDKISCRVMLVFQPSEEGLRSGAEALVKGGLMDEIDVIIGMHIENWLPSGCIGVCSGSSMASSRNFRIDFYGKTAHATLPHTGVDALAAAIRTYHTIQSMTSRELNPFAKYVCSVGKLSGGDTSVLAVNVEYAYTHIAGIAVATSTNYMVARRASSRIDADGSVTEMRSPMWFGDR